MNIWDSVELDWLIMTLRLIWFLIDGFFDAACGRVLSLPPMKFYDSLRRIRLEELLAPPSCNLVDWLGYMKGVVGDGVIFDFPFLIRRFYDVVTVLIGLAVGKTKNT